MGLRIAARMRPLWSRVVVYDRCDQFDSSHLGSVSLIRDERGLPCEQLIKL
jgi:hypothetical protein